MSQRLNYVSHSHELYKKLNELAMEVHKDVSFGQGLLHLVEIRASQINGCAFCVDMHIKQAKIHGERELRLYHLPIWRESTLFNDKERAALEWTETVTRLPEHGVSDELYQSVRAHLSEKEISDLTFAIATINAWNRLAIPFRTVPGSADAAFGLAKAGLN